MDLSRFYKAHEKDYEKALAEIKAGKKRSHWMWYIFPQLDGLGYSDIAVYYGIHGLDEAKAYDEDPLLRRHMEELCEALLQLPEDNPRIVFGSPDDLKLKSSMTLFYYASEKGEIYKKVLDKFYSGKMDVETERLLNERERRTRLSTL